MTLWQLIIREIRLRWVGFALAVASVLTAVAVLTAQVTLLAAHEANTQRILAEKQAQTEAEMRRMEDDYRKIMKELGFNLLILPAGQSLEEFYAEGRVTADMPEQHATKLAGAGLMTINHLLPALERSIRWPEQAQRRIVLVGMRGEMPLARGKPEEPIMVPVSPGSAVVGDEIRRSLTLKIGDRITLLGRSFVVSSCQPERGTRDDITIWVDLRQAQELLGTPGRINSILALQCLCKGSDIASIRRDVAKLLPGVQVIELASKALTRAEARREAAAAAKTAIEAESAHRTRLRREREALMAWLLPLVTLGAAVWVGLLAVMNVRERTSEIGILARAGSAISPDRHHLPGASRTGRAGRCCGRVRGGIRRRAVLGGSRGRGARRHGLVQSGPAGAGGSGGPGSGRRGQLVTCHRGRPPRSGRNPAEWLMAEILQMNSVRKRYRKLEGTVQALRGVSLRVESGGFVMVRGPSGCGKTTLLLTAGGLLSPDAGQVLVDGRDPYALPAEERARLRASTIGFVFQEFHLVPYLTVLENVMVPSLARPVPAPRERAEELLGRLGLSAGPDTSPPS